MSADGERVIFATDLHGSTSCWKKLLNSVAAYEASSVLIGGDLTGKVVVPIVRGRFGWRTSFLGVTYDLADKKEVLDLKNRVEGAGYYAYETTPEEVNELREDPTRVEGILMGLMVERLNGWAEMATERLKSGVRIVVIPGNDDPLAIDPVLDGGPPFINAHERIVPFLDEYRVFGFGYSNITPWHAPRELEENEIATRIDRCLSQERDFGAILFMVHVPPIDTPLDECMEIDADLRPVAGGTSLIHAGSRAVRDAIKTYQPLVSLHGHIHESRGAVKIGRTLALNPGSEYGEAVLRSVILQLRRKKGKNSVAHLFVSG
jgi:Icc-related predicted phosphoesterase